MKVEVTAEDIALGCRMRAHACPVARAVSRASGLHATVNGKLIAVFASPGDMIADDWQFRAVKQWDTPPDVARKIVDYDFGRDMEPFSFEL
jgi:hypothetical protein